MRKTKINLPHSTLTVRCFNRLRCYRAFLSMAEKIIWDVMHQQYATVNFPDINSEHLNIRLILESRLNTLAEQLDHETILYLENVLAEYRKSKNIITQFSEFKKEIERIKNKTSNFKDEQVEEEKISDQIINKLITQLQDDFTEENQLKCFDQYLKNCLLAFYHDPDWFGAESQDAKALLTGYNYTLEKLFNRLTKNFIRNTCELLNDVCRDFLMLRQAYLQTFNSNENVRLQQIISTGSDFHHQGKQVLILVFDSHSESNDDEKVTEPVRSSVKVIYKPAPTMQTSVLLLGRTQGKHGLAKFDKAFQKISSAIEMINQIMPDQPPLPTYLMTPMHRPDLPQLELPNLTDFLKQPDHQHSKAEVDEENKPAKPQVFPSQEPTMLKADAKLLEENKADFSSITNNTIDLSGYGYCEYLSSEPYPDIDFKDEFENSLSEVPLETRVRLSPTFLQDSFSRTLQEGVDKYFQTTIVRVIEQFQQGVSEYDCITDDIQVVHQYAYDCGRWLAFMLIFSIVDGHSENFLMHRQQLQPIDVDICMVAAAFTIHSTGCFENDSGGFFPDVKRPSLTNQIITLCDIRGMYSASIIYPERNRLFCSLYYINPKTGKEEPCQPDKYNLKKGLRDVFHTLLKKNFTLLQKWLEMSAGYTMVIRELPYATSYFYQKIDEARIGKFSTEELRFLDYELNLKYDNYHTEGGNPTVDNSCLCCPMQKNQENQIILFNPKKSLAYSIFHGEQVKSNLIKDYHALCVPTYYGHINQRAVHDSYGQLIEVPEFSDSTSELNGQTLVVRSHYNYHPLTPLEFIQQRIGLLQTQPKVYNTTLERLCSEIDTISGLPQVPLDSNCCEPCLSWWNCCFSFFSRKPSVTSQSAQALETQHLLDELGPSGSLYGSTEP